MMARGLSAPSARSANPRSASTCSPGLRLCHGARASASAPAPPTFLRSSTRRAISGHVASESTRRHCSALRPLPMTACSMHGLSSAR